MINKCLSLICFLVAVWLNAQTFSGKVIDGATNLPFEMVSVFFDNTTIGTTTNEKGEFSIDYNDAVQSTLIISFLGYEKVYISDYRSRNNITVTLKESADKLDEVVINADDGMSRKQKLKIFRKEFLGNSDFGKSCKILNEDVIYLRYNKADKTLTASSRSPILIKNGSLGYEISYDIVDFELVFKYLDTKTTHYTPHSVVYTGTMFYKDILLNNKKRRISKNRDKAYKGSRQHFMRALYNGNLKKEGYKLASRGFVVEEDKYVTIKPLEDSNFKSVSIDKKLDIYYKKNIGSVIQVNVPEFYLDQYGNYSPIPNVMFGGVMGSQRIGDALPLDYGLDDDIKTKTTAHSFIEGTWTVVDVVKSPEEPPFSLMTDSFKNAVFTFNPDKTINLRSSVNSNFFSITTSVVNQSLWKFKKGKDISSVLILGKDDSVKMEIFVTEKDGTTFFAIGKEQEASYFLLKVEKQ